MNRLRFHFRKIVLAVIAAACLLTVPAIISAAPQKPYQKPQQNESTESSYVLPYAIVILTIGVGVTLVCRPSRRRERAKPEQYEAGKLTSDEK